jgi:hypothetical protein
MQQGVNEIGKTKKTRQLGHRENIERGVRGWVKEGKRKREKKTYTRVYMCVCLHILHLHTCIYIYTSTNKDHLFRGRK